MTIIEKPIEEIVPYENNPRNNDSAVDALAASIKEFGFKVPIVLDRDGVIVAGHTRYKAAKKLGMATVPCVVADDLTPEQVRAFRLADNKTAELATWDYGLLSNEIVDLEQSFDMSAFGFQDNFDSLATEQPENLDGEDAAKPYVLKLTFKTSLDCEKFLDAHREEIDLMGAIASVSGGGL